MSNIYYWEKLIFSKLRFSLKENMKKCTSFAEQRCTRYIWEDVYFGIIVFSCLSSTKVSQISFDLFSLGYIRQWDCYIQGNEVDFTDIMNVSPNILAKN